MTKHLCLTTVVCVAFGLVLAGCQVSGSTVSEKEGYFTWVDEQGQVRYSPTGEPAARKEEPQQRPDADEFTETNYPDAETLRHKGYMREGGDQPYFTWRDAEGTVRSTPYQPDTRTEEEKGRVAPPAEITPANVYRATDTLLPAEPVAGHDPDAFAILGVEESNVDYLERFADTCCEALETENHERWQEGREFGIHLTEEAPVHRFLTGESPYQLISLPRGSRAEERVIRLRSYASKGVFVPSVVFLDRELNPVRLVTDLVFEYEPENWHRLGYLEARISVPPGPNEHWILLFTRDADLEGQTVIDTPYGPRGLPHIRTGEFGLIMQEAP